MKQSGVPKMPLPPFSKRDALRLQNTCPIYSKKGNWIRLQYVGISDELQALGRLVNAYLDIAKDMAERHIPMTMEDWAKRIDKFLDTTDREILHDAGRISAEYAKEYAEIEFEKYRVIQDSLFRSDFDKLNEAGTSYGA